MPRMHWQTEPLTCRDHAVISCFDLYSIGIGPSSSHTVGPMRAANRWAELSNLYNDPRVDAVAITLYGSLAATGEGHGTPAAILAGIEGGLPATIDTQSINPGRLRIEAEKLLRLPTGKTVRYLGMAFKADQFLPGHSNAMRLSSFDKDSNVVASELWYSVGGGFIVKEGEDPKASSVVNLPVPLPFCNAQDLLDMCEHHKLTIPQVVMVNETARRSEEEVKKGLMEIWSVMNASILRGCTSTEQHLPGSLRLMRRAPRLYNNMRHVGDSLGDATHILDRGASGADTRLDWLSMFAMAVNEENAAGSRIVTAPTNGAAGVIPSVFKYYRKFIRPRPDGAEIDPDAVNYLLTCGAIGMLAKKNASISAAEAGCQAEIGVASSMAAAGLVYLYGGQPYQSETAAEIAMEHSLGLSCDPVGGFVQIPCIERNAIGAMKALGAARLAIHVDDNNNRRVSLDQCLETMRITGEDMSQRYKETSTGGLSLVVPLC